MNGPRLAASVVLLLLATFVAMSSVYTVSEVEQAIITQFGRPIGSFQAIKHRLADMKTWLEASYAIIAATAVAIADRTDQAGELARAAKAYIGQYGPELMHECVQLHGGIGLTREHDLHLYLRRVTTNAMLYGTPAEHRQRIADRVQLPEER